MTTREMMDIRIQDIGARGDGIAETERGRIYVPYTAPGDLVRVHNLTKRGDGYAARAEAILEDGDQRTEPACPHFGECGGCSLQHLALDAYLAYKRGLVTTALARQGLAGAPVEPCVSFGAATRRRASLKAVGTARGAVVGFNQAGSHSIVNIDACPVVVSAIAGLLQPLRGLLGGMLKTGKRVPIAVTQSDTGLDVLLGLGGALDGGARQTLAAFATDNGLARLCVGTPDDAEEIVVVHAPEISVDGMPIVPPPGAFLQASREAERFLVAFAVEHLSGAKRIADLFSGCGTFALPLARDAEVTAYDIDAQMVAACRAAADRAGGRVAGLRAVRKDLFRSPVMTAELVGLEGVIVDPPRAGAKAQAAEIAASEVARVVAISCNPATFARDARVLVDGGYRLEKVVPLDQFVWSAHVELAAVFEKTS